MTIYVFSGSLTRPDPNYRAANGRGIGSFIFDEVGGRLEIVASCGGVGDASWLSVDPTGRRLYAACEQPGVGQSLVTSFSIGSQGELTEVNRQQTGGQTACHMTFSRDGKFLLVANYNAQVPPGAADGALAIFPLGPGGELLPPSALIQHRGSGTNPARQTRSHAHCILAGPDGHLIYVCDLGLDRIVVYALGADGALNHRPELDFAVPAGRGPRHMVFQPDGRRLFVVCELIPVVMTLEIDTETGAMTEVDCLPIERRGEAIVQPAGILWADGSLFVGLRECNEILGVAVNSLSGKLSRRGRWASGGATPRDFVLSPSGRHLLVANQDSDALTVFPVDAGMLGEPTQTILVGTPMALALTTRA